MGPAHSDAQPLPRGLPWEEGGSPHHHGHPWWLSSMGSALLFPPPQQQGDHQQQPGFLAHGCQPKNLSCNTPGQPTAHPKHCLFSYLLQCPDPKGNTALLPMQPEQGNTMPMTKHASSTSQHQNTERGGRRGCTLPQPAVGEPKTQGGGSRALPGAAWGESTREAPRAAAHRRSADPPSPSPHIGPRKIAASFLHPATTMQQRGAARGQGRASRRQEKPTWSWEQRTAPTAIAPTPHSPTSWCCSNTLLPMCINTNKTHPHPAGRRAALGAPRLACLTPASLLSSLLPCCFNPMGKSHLMGQGKLISNKIKIKIKA